MQQEVDFLIIGTGIAGLTAARILGKAGKTLLTTKGKIEDSATEMAQGGIAAAVHEEDSSQAHFEDTMRAGAGLCDPEAVKILVEQGPARVRELIALGANFDRDGEEYELTQEGAHRRPRIFHAGDSTGAEIGKTLGRAILREQQAELLDFLFIADLLIKDGICVGAQGWDLKRQAPVTIAAKTVILSTGGLGQIYEYSTNPRTATGDGIAMAYRAGARICDMEFIQFHPTALALTAGSPLGGPPSSIFLISEAVRGEGALLLNQRGERFMPRYHPQAELAPRDIVARAIWQEMKNENSHNVMLSLEKLPKEKIPIRFPTIYRRCLELSLNITQDPIPVAPAAHYAMGGIKTDLKGQTSIPGLFAAGEVAAVGVHGANRLASNSLLDGLVFGHRAAHQAITWQKVAKVLPKDVLPPTGKLEKTAEQRQDIASSRDQEVLSTLRHTLKKLMWEQVGLIRNEAELTSAERTLQALQQHLAKLPTHAPDKKEVENMFTVAKLVTQAALHRKESRGAHFRSDFPNPSPVWEQHLFSAGKSV